MPHSATTSAGWHNPPPTEPPRDYAVPEPEPPYIGTNPIRKGATAAWSVVGVVGFAFVFPFALIVAGLAYVWWEVMQWLTDTE